MQCSTEQQAGSNKGDQPLRKQVAGLAAVRRKAMTQRVPELVRVRGPGEAGAEKLQRKSLTKKERKGTNIPPRKRERGQAE